MLRIWTLQPSSFVKTGIFSPAAQEIKNNMEFYEKIKVSFTSLAADIM